MENNNKFKWRISRDGLEMLERFAHGDKEATKAIILALEDRMLSHSHSDEPTVILSKAIEQIEQMGNYKVMMALVDAEGFKNGKPKDDCLHTFCDIESKKLREVIYKEMEKDM